MLTENEKRCCKRFLLREFETIELILLAQTVTNRMVTVQGKHEAIKAIVSHSESVYELLQRKKVRREHIFRFLGSENVAVTGTSGKATLMSQFSRHCETQAPAKREAVEVPKAPNIQTQVPKAPNIQTQVPKAPNIQIASSSVSYVFVEQHIHEAGSCSTKVPSITQELAQQFTSWFYSQLNSSAQGSTPTPAEWGPQHFWDDSKLRLIIITSERRKEVFEGAELVANRLKRLVGDDGLAFNPNTGPSGTSGFEDPHGLVIVRVCGTIHQHDKCLGLFEQQFGLISNPLTQNNWKIKFTDMSLKQCAVERMPALEGPPDRLQAIM